MFLHKSYHRELTRTSSFLFTHSLSITTGSEQTITTTLQFLILNKKTAKTTDLTYANLYTTE